jgi:DNA repair photolyase
MSFEMASLHQIRGRGTAHNPANRFDEISFEREEGWDDAEDPHPNAKTIYYRDHAKTVIARNESPDVGFSASVNPFRGCENGCIYCFARPSHEFLGLSAGLDFESRIFVKEDAPELLRQALANPRWNPEVIGMSGVTDCYQPIERKLQLTRRCLEVLAAFRNPVTIITKNHLVTRDIDIISDMAAWDGVTVNISITSLNEKLQRVMEPRASTPRRRLDAVEKLAKAGVRVRVLAAPMIPGLTDHELASIIKASAEAGAQAAGYIPLRLPYVVKELFEAWLDTNFPERKEKVLHRIREIRGGKLNDPKFGSRMRGEGEYANQLALLFRAACRKAGLQDGDLSPLRTDHFRRPHDLGGQLGLFEGAT